jgi:hypothetical protein
MRWKLAIGITLGLLCCMAFGYEATLGIILLLLWGWYSSWFLGRIQEREQQREQQREADASGRDSQNISA